MRWFIFLACVDGLVEHARLLFDTPDYYYFLSSCCGHVQAPLLSIAGYQQGVRMSLVAAIKDNYILPNDWLVDQGFYGCLYLQEGGFPLYQVLFTL